MYYPIPKGLYPRVRGGGGASALTMPRTTRSSESHSEQRCRCFFYSIVDVVQCLYVRDDGFCFELAASNQGRAVVCRAAWVSYTVTFTQLSVALNIFAFLFNLGVFINLRVFVKE